MALFGEAPKAEPAEANNKEGHAGLLGGSLAEERKTKKTEGEDKVGAAGVVRVASAPSLSACRDLPTDLDDLTDLV